MSKMKKPENHLQTLSEIRSLMERSSRFISLSGLSGIFAGIFALLGATAAYLYLKIGLFSRSYYTYATDDRGSIKMDFITFFFTDAILVLVFSLIFGFYFTRRNARKKGLKVWDKTAERLFGNFIIPLVTGGLFCLVLLYHHLVYLIAPCTLIFYGLALLNASKYTLHEVRYLGISEVLLGLISSIYIGFGLLFWAIGFGILHIVYGTVMYFKYENRS